MQDNKGRGAQSNATGRFNALRIEEIPMDDLEMGPGPKTKFFKDHSKSIVTENKSPDLKFRYSLNAYRGCEHGCAYCYARPTHEYFGLSAGLDFESKIFVKENAPELLGKKLMNPNWEPDTIFMSGVTDCYQPAERKFELTRRCLKVLAEFRNPVGLITKNALVARDVDILRDLAQDQAAMVILSITTLDAGLARALEPRTSSPQAKLRAMETLAQAGVPVGVNIAPLIPGLTDHEIPRILKAAHEAGATFAGLVPLRLPYSVKDIFSEWLEAHYPLKKNKVLHSIREIRGGELNSSEFGSRMRGEGAAAEAFHKLFEVFEQKYQFNQDEIALSTKAFRRKGEQLSLF